MTRRHHVAAALGLLAVTCSHGHPAALPVQRPVPETLPALDTATYADVVPVTTTTVAPEPETTTTVPPAPVARAVPVTTTTEPAPMGERTVRGDLPPDCIVQRESGGDYGAVNPSSGAGGRYQFLPSTWTAVGGSGLPEDASPAEQDYRAALLWDGGNGASHWGGGC